MHSLIARINNGEILVADGAMGSMLMARGLSRGSCPESYNLSHPEILSEIAGLYFSAGAEIIQTNTFGGSSLKLSDYHLQDKTEEINRNAYLAVKKQLGDKAYISGSCGPSGKILKPYGDTDPEEMYKSFQRQLKVLIESGIDIICVETMTDITEAVLALKAVKSISNDLPIMATMTFDETPKGFFTIMGVSVAQAADELEKAGADIIGSNCGNGIEKMILIAREFKKHSRLPILIQPNAGIPVLKEDRLSYPETPQFMAEKSRELIHSGVSIIGGCCGTTPEHIRAIRELVNSHHTGS